MPCPCDPLKVRSTLPRARPSASSVIERTRWVGCVTLRPFVVRRARAARDSAGLPPLGGRRWDMLVASFRAELMVSAESLPRVRRPVCARVAVGRLERLQSGALPQPGSTAETVESGISSSSLISTVVIRTRRSGATQRPDPRLYEQAPGAAPTSDPQAPPCLRRRYRPTHFDAVRLLSRRPQPRRRAVCR